MSVASSDDNSVALEPAITTWVCSSPFSEATARSHSAICCTSSTMTTRGSVAAGVRLYVVHQIPRGTQLVERERLLVHVHHLAFVAQRCCELSQEDTFPGPPDTGYRGDDGGVQKLPEPFEVTAAQDLHLFRV